MGRAGTRSDREALLGTGSDVPPMKDTSEEAESCLDRQTETEVSGLAQNLEMGRGPHKEQGPDGRPWA